MHLSNGWRQPGRVELAATEHTVGNAAAEPPETGTAKLISAELR
ncbi:hypothetical protein [Streptomyces sp. SID13031]|nr:hypothetical protein [Streptomyces sp. SID13031]